MVTFCLRWHATSAHSVCPDPECSISWGTAMFWPLAFYSLWQVHHLIGCRDYDRSLAAQVAYLIKTELMDKEKMSRDKDLVTSLRWMTVRSKPALSVSNIEGQDTKPHPLYKAARKHGYTGSAVFVLIGVPCPQFCDSTHHLQLSNSCTPPLRFYRRTSSISTTGRTWLRSW